MLKLELYNEDCLEAMKRIPDHSIHLILCDLPYGTTSCSWDAIIPTELLWNAYNRVISIGGAVVLFANQPFTSILTCSNLTEFKYKYTWLKSRPTGFNNAKLRPLKTTEDILVFKSRIYNPQGLVRCNREMTNSKHKQSKMMSPSVHDGGTYQPTYVQEWTNYPRDLLEFASVTGAVHPTQKPLTLIEYLILTYSNEGDTVLDNCMGSGTTVVACVNTGRNCIGMESDITHGYYDKAVARIAAAQEAVMLGGKGT